jgi:hypothetical protein
MPRRSKHVTALVLTWAGLTGLGAAPQAAPTASPPAKPPTATPVPAAAPALPNAHGSEKPTTSEKVPPAPPDAFDRALAAHYHGDPVEGAQLFYWFIHTNSQLADAYPWAQFFLAEDLAKLGFTQAAVSYFAVVARDRAKPEILPLALADLEKLSEAGPVDEDLVFRELIYGTEFGRLSPALKDFVEFHRGQVDFREGRVRWGERHFKAIRPTSDYFAKARELQAVYHLTHDGDVHGVLGEFLSLAKDPKTPLEVRNEARINAARLAYEEKDYPHALELYDSVQLPVLDPGRGAIYLERAWVLYRLNDLSRTSGFLVALDAPSFKNLFLPEKYLLRALVYKDKCHYLPAKRAAREFRRKFSRSLTAVRNRDDLLEDARIRQAALETGPVAKAQRRVDQIQLEKDQINRYVAQFAAPGLTARLREIYDLTESEALRQKQLLLQDALYEVADKMLRAEENLRLLDYEVGLDMYRRIKRNEFKAAAVIEDAPIVGREMRFDFNDEYWNDELRSYRLFLKSRCAEVGAAE